MSQLYSFPPEVAERVSVAAMMTPIRLAQLQVTEPVQDNVPTDTEHL